MSSEILESKLNVSNVKFTSKINPYLNAELVLELFLLQDDSIVKVKNITKFNDNSVVLKFNGTFIKK